MLPADIATGAFKLATLRSERIRIISLLVFFVILAVVFVVRSFILGGDVQSVLGPRVLGCIAVLVAYESFALVYVQRTLAAERELPLSIAIMHAFVETMFPTALLFMITESPFLGPYRALVAPAISAYFYLIILSTLRLSPLLCALTGAFCSVGYGLMLAYTYIAYGELAASDVNLGPAVYATYLMSFVAAGGVAGAVAHQVRRHVVVALREVETRREVERMEHDLDIARSIQQGLLPDAPPSLPGYEVAGWNQPADQTGGDYYDMVRLPSGRLAITLADVSGHGIGPALVTAVCRAYARASLDLSGTLDAGMDRLNELLYADLPDDRFVTFVAALLDAEHHTIEMLSAGHGPQVYYSAANDTVTLSPADDVPLGIMERVGYGPSRTVAIAPGDVLVMLTDGFFEWASASGEQFGTGRLAASMKAHASKDADAIIRGLYADVRAFVGETIQGDDLTAVVIKRSP